MRRRFQKTKDPVTSSLITKPPGAAKRDSKLSIEAERVIEQVLTLWLLGQRRLAHPVRDVTVNKATASL